MTNFALIFRNLIKKDWKKLSVTLLGLVYFAIFYAPMMTNIYHRRHSARPIQNASRGRRRPERTRPQLSSRQIDTASRRLVRNDRLLSDKRPTHHSRLNHSDPKNRRLFPCDKRTLRLFPRHERPTLFSLSLARSPTLCHSQRRQKRNIQPSLRPLHRPRLHRFIQPHTVSPQPPRLGLSKQPFRWEPLALSASNAAFGRVSKPHHSEFTDPS